MGLVNLFKRTAAEGAKYRAIKRTWWGDRVLAVGEEVTISDPAVARQLVGAGKIVPADASAEDHLRGPARWIEQPRTTSINPKAGGVFSRRTPWSQI